MPRARPFVDFELPAADFGLPDALREADFPAAFFAAAGLAAAPLSFAAGGCALVARAGAFSLGAAVAGAFAFVAVGFAAFTGSATVAALFFRAVNPGRRVARCAILLLTGGGERAADMAPDECREK